MHLKNRIAGITTQQWSTGLIYLIVGFAGSTIIEISRINYFMWLPFANLLFLIKYQRPKAFWFTSAMLVLLLVNIIISDYRYLPYTNFFAIYPFEGEQSFSERSSFHLEQ